MRKSIAAVLAFAIIFAFLPVPHAYAEQTAAQNLIEDGDFESIPLGRYVYFQDGEWMGDGFSSSTEWVSGTVVNDRSYSGNRSIKVHATYQTFDKTVSLKKNTDYTYIFYYYLESGANTKLDYICAVDPDSVHNGGNGRWTIAPFKYLYYDGSKNTPAIATVNDKWTKVVFNFNSGDMEEVKLCIKYHTGASVQIYYDDFQLYETSAYTTLSENLIDNGELSSINNFSSGGGTFGFDGFSGRFSSGSVSAAYDASFPNGIKNNKNTVNISLNSGSFQMWSKDTYMLKENTEYEVSFYVKTDNMSGVKAFIYEPVFTDRLNRSGQQSSSPIEGGNIYSYEYDGGADTENPPYRKTRIARDDVIYDYFIAGVPLETTAASMMYTRKDNVSFDPSEEYGEGGWVEIKATFKTGSGSWSYSGEGAGAQELPYAANVALGLGCIEQSGRSSISIGGMTLKEVTANVKDIAPGVYYKGASIRTTGSQALRFKTEISRQVLATEYPEYEVVECGAVVIKSEYLGEAELIKGGSYGTGGNKKSITSTLWKQGDGEFPQDGIFTAALINIASSDYNKPYSFRPYIVLKNGGSEKTLYGITQSASIAEVSLAALNAKNTDQTFMEPSEIRKLIEERFISRLTPETLRVYNSRSPHIDEFYGFNWTVYHAMTFMDDAYGRNYTDEMAKIEMDRLKDSGIKVCRTIFRSTWAGGTGSSFTGWNWDSEEMQAVYKWARELEKRDIDVMLNVGWQIDSIATPGDSGNWYIETPYITGVGSDYYGESNGADMSGLTSEQQRMKRAALRYGEWASQALEAFRARGINNVKYMLAFTEPSRQFADGSTTPAGPLAAQYLTLVEGLDEMLTKHGLRGSVKIIGPNQGSTDYGEGSLLDYALKNINKRSTIDIYSQHFYPPSMGLSKNNLFAHEDFWLVCDEIYTTYNNVLKANNYNGIFLADEFMAIGGRPPLGLEGSFMGTQTVVGVINAMKNKVNGVLSWQIFDQLWVNQTNTAGEFENGIHAVGTAPSLLESYVPRNHYYAISLFTRYISDGNVKVLQCDFKTGTNLYYAVTETSDGDITIAAVNTGENPEYVCFSFDSALNRTFNRHMFDPASVYPTEEAKLAGIDKTFAVEKTLKDVIPSGGVMIYTTRTD